MVKPDKNRGFTLIELMIVVAIMGVLAAVAVAAYNLYIEQSHDAEATSILADIRLKQEAYRGTFHQYADDPAACNQWVPRNVPNSEPSSDAVNAACAPAWRQLGISLPQNLYFVYDFEAGGPADASQGRYVNANPANDDFWYGAAAIQDLDNDGKCKGFVVISGNMSMTERAEAAAECTL